jgi:hypothetical protein
LHLFEGAKQQVRKEGMGNIKLEKVFHNDNQLKSHSLARKMEPVGETHPWVEAILLPDAFKKAEGILVSAILSPEVNSS